MQSKSYLSYWAKADEAPVANTPVFHRVPYHLLDVAACFQELMNRVSGATSHLSRLVGLDESSFIPTFTWLVALHDAGKFSDSFQGLRPDIQLELQGHQSRIGYHIRHDALGRYLLTYQLLAKRGDRDWLNLRDYFSSSRAARRALKPIVESIASHHGQPAQTPRLRDVESKFTDANYVAFREFASDFYELLGPTPRWAVDSEDIATRLSLGSWAIAGWMVLADWLGSKREFFPYEEGEIELEDYWNRAQRLATDAIELSGVIAPESRIYQGFKTLFPAFEEISPLQDYAEQIELRDGPQFFILEDATGSGKTEASLILASRLMNQGVGNGVYIGLPTTATANGMYSRMAESYQRFYSPDQQQASLMLAHSARDIDDRFQSSINIASDASDADETYDGGNKDETASASCTSWLSDTRKKSLLAPFGVGTIDQALLAGLPARHQSLRLAGLSQKILIVDEVHAFDEYMINLLENLLSFHAAQGGSAILLSATIPKTLRQLYCDAFFDGTNLHSVEVTSDAFPLATHCRGEGLTETALAEHGEKAKAAGRSIREQTSHDVQVRLEPSLDNCIDALISTAEEGGCACWIRNTVGEAISAYEHLQGLVPEEKLTLFHARFTLLDRNRIEEKVLRLFGKDSTPEERAGRIVIATQVIEQSLDLDFDCMVTDLAPIDLIIQRAGRLHRHQRQRDYKPTLLVYGPEPTDDADEDWYADAFEGAQWVYKDHAKLWLTARVLKDKGRIQIPHMARDLVEFVYGDSADIEAPIALDESSFDAFVEEIEHKNMAEFNALNFNRGYGEGSSGRWFEDCLTPTRLGDPSITLRLGRRLDEDQILPWAESEKHQWRLSEISIRASKLAELADDIGLASSAIQAALETMKDKGKWSELIPLSPPDGDGDAWSCPVIDHKDQQKVLTYSKTRGLTFESEKL